MKKIKKIFSLLLTLVLSFCMVNTVSAEGTGSIKVKDTTEGKTYEIYKIFNLTYKGSNVAYTIDSDWTSFFEGDGSLYIVDANNDEGTLNPITIGSATKYIDITDSNVMAFTQKALAYATGIAFDQSAEATSDTLTFSGLDLGYYLVYPKGATDIKDTYGSICSITSTLPDAEVTIKATYPTIDKTADKHNVDVGEVVNFDVTGQVPDTTGYSAYTYKIMDTMTEGLLFSEDLFNKLTIKFGDNIITINDDNSSYTSLVYTNNGFELTFDMTKYQDYVGEDIIVTYSAIVTEEAVNNDVTNNSATLTYSNDPKDSTKTITTPPVIEKVYSSKLEVIKVDAKDESVRLAGASFVLKNAEGKFYQAVGANGIITSTEDASIITTDGVLVVNWVDSQDEATLLVTDETGVVTFKGIKNGTYELIEVEASEGYNKLTGPVTVKVGYNEDGTGLVETSVTYVETVKNNSGTALPITGGLGTKLFVVIGSLLAVVSSIVLITNKRMGE